MKNEFIVTSRVTAFREAVSVVEDTVKGQPGLMVVWGKTGRGKSRCLEKYATDTPAIHYYINNELSPTAMLQDICYELNKMRPGAKARAKRIIVEEMDDNPKTLLIDEADKLCINCIEHLRDIHDATGVPIVLVGEPQLYGKLHSRARLWGRVTRTVEFGPVELSDIVLLAMKACGLKIKPNAASGLRRRCKGDFRPLYHDLRDLEIRAKANDLTEIDIDLVATLPDRHREPSPEKEA